MSSKNFIAIFMCAVCISVTPLFGDDGRAHIKLDAIKMCDYQITDKSNKVFEGNIDRLEHSAGGYISDIAVDETNKKIYFANSGIIARSNYDGSGKEIILNRSAFPGKISLDSRNGKIYWTENSEGANHIINKIMKSDLDGSNVETAHYYRQYRDSSHTGMPSDARNLLDYKINFETNDIYAHYRSYGIDSNQVNYESFQLIKLLPNGTVELISDIGRQNSLKSFIVDNVRGRIYAAIQESGSSTNVYSFQSNGQNRKLEFTVNQPISKLLFANSDVVVYATTDNETSNPKINIYNFRDQGVRDITPEYNSNYFTSSKIAFDASLGLLFVPNATERTANILHPDKILISKIDKQIISNNKYLDEPSNHLFTQGDLIDYRDKKIYSLAPVTGKTNIIRQNFDGSNEEVVLIVIHNNTYIHSLHFDNVTRSLYYVKQGVSSLYGVRPSIMKYSVDNGTESRLVEANGERVIYQVDEISKRLYWSELLGDTFSISTETGTNVRAEPLFQSVIHFRYDNSLASPSNVVFDHVVNKIFWGLAGPNGEFDYSASLFSAGMDMSNKTEILHVPSNGYRVTIKDILVDHRNSRLYFVINRDTSTLASINFDGSNFKEIKIGEEISISHIANRSYKHTISGVVKKDGIPHSGIAVTLESIGTTNTDANGLFTFSNITQCTPINLTIEGLSGYEITAPNLPNSISENLNVEFLINKLDTDDDGIPDINDGDDDGDGLSDIEETALNLNPLNPDSDGDGIIDSQEITDKTNPRDRGSATPKLSDTICSEWNGFLGMYNIMEHVNLTESDVPVRSTLYNSVGDVESSIDFNLPAGRQFDLLVHDIKGWKRDSYGKICSRVLSSQNGVLNGRMMYYKPNTSNGLFDFAVPIPFTRGQKGKQYLSYNTFHPAGVSQAGEVVSNWLQINNLTNQPQSGKLNFYRGDGKIFGWESVNLPPNGRYDVAAHRFGSQRLGLIEWLPDRDDANFQVKIMRYFADSSRGTNAFDGATQISAATGTFEPMSIPVSKKEMSSIVEITNPSSSSQDINVKLYDYNGGLIREENRALSARSSYHFIVNPYLTTNEGNVIVTPLNNSPVVATGMYYGFDTAGGLSYVFSLEGLSPYGSVLKGTYNTFLKQGCELLVKNSSNSSTVINISAKGTDGVPILQGDERSLPAFGSYSFSLCDLEQKENYGVVTVQSNKQGAINSYMIRKGFQDTYRFGTNLSE